MSVEIVILAAGQGTRMRSALPKVLHPIAGVPMVQHVINTSQQISNKIHVVVGHGAEDVKRLSSGVMQWSMQEQQLGTGHAVLQALPNIDDDSSVLILYGDVPLIRLSTLQTMIENVNAKNLNLLTVKLSDPTGYGRIVRNADGDVIAIVEHKDASEFQKSISEVNTGIISVKANLLKKWLPLLSNNNAQGEYYLTDIIEIANSKGCSVTAIQPKYIEEVKGVNNKLQLSELERWYQRQIADQIMAKGVTLIDPLRFDCRDEMSVGRDVTIDVNNVFMGNVTLGDNVTIGPNCVITDSVIGNNVVVEANSIIEKSKVGNECVIGPFARIRPGTELASNVKIGNFVETKKSIIGAGSKVNHLTYIGDALIGSGTNVGAGTITCNYDGVNKHKTVLGDNVFIGSNTSLVAPVTIKDGSTVGAGSTITRDVAEGELAIARGKQRNIQGWERPQKKQ